MSNMLRNRPAEFLALQTASPLIEKFDFFPFISLEGKEEFTSQRNDWKEVNMSLLHIKIPQYISA